MFQGQYRTVPGPGSHFLCDPRPGSQERERIARFQGQERVPVRSIPEKNFRNALLRSTEIRNAFRNADRFFRSCPSLVGFAVCLGKGSKAQTWLGELYILRWEEKRLHRWAALTKKPSSWKLAVSWPPLVAGAHDVNVGTLANRCLSSSAAASRWLSIMSLCR